MLPDRSDTVPQGTIRIGLNVEAQIALSRIVCHWTKDEAQKLRDGDPEARQILIEQSCGLAMREGQSEVDWFELWVDGGTKITEVQ